MSDATTNSPVSKSPFWRFSVKFYAVAGVAQACIDLQDQARVDVNILFFLLWNATQKRALNATEVAEVEPNSNLKQAQPIGLNVTVSGVITSEDVDHFAVELKKGDRLNVELDGLRLGSNTFFDPTLSLRMPDGRRDRFLRARRGIAALRAPARRGAEVVATAQAQVLAQRQGAAGNPTAHPASSTPATTSRTQAMWKLLPERLFALPPRRLPGQACGRASPSPCAGSPVRRRRCEPARSRSCRPS